MKLHAARSDHGEYSPNSLSALFDFGKVRIMDTGDTALTMDYLQPLIDRKPDALLTCINGSFGNLNAHEAAQLTAATMPRVVLLAISGRSGSITRRRGATHIRLSRNAQSCAHRCPSSFSRRVRG